MLLVVLDTLVKVNPLLLKTILRTGGLYGCFSVNYSVP